MAQMISPCLSFKILSGVCNLLLSSTEYITVSQYINCAVAIVLQFDLEMPKLLYLPFLDGIVSTNLSACVYIYIYYIINFIETDQGPRANKIMFYTADKKVN